MDLKTSPYDLSLLWLYTYYGDILQAAMYDLSVSHSVEPAALQSSANGLTSAQASSKCVDR